MSGTPNSRLLNTCRVCTGVTLIEFAQMEPPNHQMQPMRVLLKIQKAEPPKLDRPSLWSKQFNDFLAYCLVKDPQQRPNASDLLNHEFIRDFTDKKPILALISEYKAEVVEEVVEENEDEIIEVCFSIRFASILFLTISSFLSLSLIEEEKFE